MSPSLSLYGYVLGALSLAAGLAALIQPHLFRRGLSAFPRNARAARVLTAISLVWVAALLFQTHLGRFEHLKPSLYLLTPLAYFLMIRYLDELLAPRALGGILLLAASPVLTATRLHRWDGGSDLALVVTVLCYLAVMVGVILVLSPFRFRSMLRGPMENAEHCKLFGMVWSGVGALILVLAATVY